MVSLADRGLARLQASLLERVVVFDDFYGELYAALRLRKGVSAAMRMVRVCDLLSAGFSERETAARVGCTTRTVRRDLMLARSCQRDLARTVAV
jgi:ECF sigma factor